MVFHLARRSPLGGGNKSAKMYPAYWWRETPGHDEDSRAPVLSRDSVARDHFLYQAAGAPLDCSAIS
jgi:hypothetical protein